MLPPSNDDGRWVLAFSFTSWVLLLAVLGGLLFAVESLLR